MAEVGVTNNDPDVTAGYLLDAIRSVGGVPRILRADKGTENVHVAAFQRFFQREGVDAFVGEKSFMYRRSVTILPAGVPKIVKRSDKLEKMPI